MVNRKIREGKTVREKETNKMKYLASIILAVAMLAFPFASLGGQASVLAAPLSYSGFPTFSIVSVHTNTSVTIQTHNLPPNYNFQVRMGKMHTKAINGTIVGSFASGSGGTQNFTFNIPSNLHGLHQIAIRFDAISGVNYFAYNWFFNTSTGGTTSSGNTGFPTFSIVSVVAQPRALRTRTEKSWLAARAMHISSEF